MARQLFNEETGCISGPGDLTEAYRLRGPLGKPYQPANSEDQHLIDWWKTLPEQRQQEIIIHVPMYGLPYGLFIGRLRAALQSHNKQEP